MALDANVASHFQPQCGLRARRLCWQQPVPQDLAILFDPNMGPVCVASTATNLMHLLLMSCR